MATRSFLTESESAECLKLWQKQEPAAISFWLQNIVLQKLSSFQDFEKLQIFGLGSLARQELCPKSDIDLLILGDTESTKRFMQAALESGLQIRARTFEDADSVLEGAEVFDVLSMSQLYTFPSKAVVAGKTAEQSAQLIHYIVDKHLVRNRARVYKTLKQEKAERKKRFDSLVNYLEPNLKLGSGGIRDIQQSLYLFEVFPEKFEGAEDNRQILLRDKSKLLNVRQGLHLLGFSDALVAQAQLELTKLLGFEDISSLMMDVERAFSEAAFYASWALEKARSKATVTTHPSKLSLSEVEKALRKDASEITQEQLRKVKLKMSPSDFKNRDLRRWVHSEMPEPLLMAFFQSRMAYQVFPDLLKVEGLVQHDQYHLLTVDAHLKQAMRQVLRARRNPNHLGPKMKKLSSSFKSLDWEALFWAALFHDIAKGRKGDHSTVGAKLCRKVMAELGFDTKLSEEVAWLVENHLIFSVAAFRRNPRSPKTLHWLLERGVKGPRIARLAYFTAIDIYATNPTAWNSWKENLLVDVAMELGSSKARKLERFLIGLSRGVMLRDLEFYSQIEPRLLTELPGKILRADLKSMQGEKADLPPLVVSAGKGKFWVRFHNRKDIHGIFLRYVRALHDSGLSVIEAFVQTFPTYGVYDWFLVRGGRSAEATRKLLKLSLESDAIVKIKPVHFEKVEVVEQDEGTAIVSFRGLDQKGALLAAADSLYAGGMPISWAKVNTWGRRIDDVFGVQCTPESLQFYRDKVVPNLLVPSSVTPSEVE